MNWCQGDEWEHLRGLRYPHSRTGRLGKYRILRPAFGTLGFLPICIVDPEHRALSLESTMYGNENIPLQVHEHLSRDIIFRSLFIEF